MTVCGRCSEENPDRARFCLACGSELLPDTTSSQVRKTVTLVFADLIGSTALGEQLEPEALRAVTDRYFEEMRRVVEHHGGTVEKFVGDAVLAVFGVPVAHEDDALRAVRAAADMQAALARANEEISTTWSVRIAVRIGVNSGQVVVGSARAGGSFATGDAVNVAARLEQAAEPGQVLLGASTLRLVEDWVEVDVIPPLTLKGKTEPVEACILRNVRSRARRAHEQRAAPLVGRDDDLVLLRAAIHRAVQGSRPHVLTISGVAGVGKSRLLTELVESLDESATVLTGACMSYGDATAIGAVGDLVRSAIEAEEATIPAAEANRRLLAILGETAEARLAADRLAAAAELGGVTGSSEELATSLRRLLAALAQHGPVLVVLEDLHFAQPGLLDVIETAVARLEAAAVLVATTRPQLWEQRSSWGAATADSVTLTLQPLPDADVRTLASHLLGGAVGGDVVTALSTTEGNPLFVEHVLAALRENGALRAVGDRWTVVDASAVQQVPATVNAILGARIDQLPVAERAVLERASVIGRSFPATAVQSLLGDEDRDSVAAALRALRDKSLLTETEQTPPWYTFAHALLREAAYDRMPKAVRADLHIRFVDWLDAAGLDPADPNTNVAFDLLAGLRLSADDVAAYHLVAALRLRRELGGPGADDRLAERCVEHVRRASNRLVAVEPGTARRLLVDAWDACGPDRAARLELLPSTLAAFTDGVEARTFLRVATEARQQATGTSWEAVTEAVRYAAQFYSGDFDVTAWEEAITSARSAAGDDRRLQALVARLAALRSTMGDTAPATLLEAHEDAAAAAKLAGDDEMEAHALSDIATFLHFADGPVAELLIRAREIDAGLAGRPFLQSHSRAAMALALAELGRAEDALAAAAESRALFGLATGTDFDPVYSGFFLADVEVLAGDPEAGCATLQRAATAGEHSYQATFLAMWVERAAIHLHADVGATVTEVLGMSIELQEDIDPVLLRTAAAVAASGPIERAAALEAYEAWLARRDQGPYLWLGPAPLVILALGRAGLRPEADAAQRNALSMADELGYAARAAHLRTLTRRLSVTGS